VSSGAATGSGSVSGPRRVITPSSGFELPSLHELWDSRDLIYLMAKRDVDIRYKQTAIGAAWAIVQPLALAAVFSLFLGRYARVPSGGDVPYPLFALAGMVLWLYISTSVTHITSSTVANSTLITKVYFPRVIIPLSASAQPLLDFLVAFAVVIPASFLFGVTPSLRVFALPLLVVLVWMLALGLGLLLSALNVRYRDIALVIPFLILVGLFITPIVYPFDLVPEAVQPFYAINPLVGVMETYRWLLFPGAPDPGLLLLAPLLAAPLLLVLGAWYFKRAEREFADII
jgi:lipopolysaccharide transport system permease protein